MKTHSLAIAIAVALSMTSASVLAQAVAPGAGNTRQKAPVDAGAIIMPPETGPDSMQNSSGGVDPKIFLPPAGEVKTIPPEALSKKRSEQADCKGRADLCRQDSAR